MNPNYGIIKRMWCTLGKPCRNKLVRLENIWKYSIKKDANPFVDMKRLIKKENPVIVDGGASNGSTTVTFKQYVPKSTILAFEPLSFVDFEKFTKEFKDVHISYLALGEKGKKVKFFETNYPDTSSILIHSESKQKDYLGIKSEKDVNVASLDEWVNDNHFIEVDILKLDLQGYELNALRGAKKLLKSSIKIVYVECSFKEFYISQPLFDEVQEFLLSLGFKVWNIYRGSNQGPIGYVDVLFYKGD